VRWRGRVKQGVDIGGLLFNRLILGEQKAPTRSTRRLESEIGQKLNMPLWPTTVAMDLTRLEIGNRIPNGLRIQKKRSRSSWVPTSAYLGTSNKANTTVAGTFQFGATGNYATSPILAPFLPHKQFGRPQPLLC
jgi:hypothetical protein